MITRLVKAGLIVVGIGFFCVLPFANQANAASLKELDTQSIQAEAAAEKYRDLQQ